MKSLSTLVTLFLMVVLLIMSLSSCNSTDKRTVRTTSTHTTPGLFGAPASQVTTTTEAPYESGFAKDAGKAGIELFSHP